MYCGSVEFVCLPSMVGHVPVLLDECMDYLDPGKGGNFADLTFGGGGHSRAILEANEANTLLAFDCDPDAGARAGGSFEDFGGRFQFNDLSFREMDKVSSPDEFDGVLMDLGISSFQLMEPNKGFSFRLDAPIDMRLDPRVGQSADFLESASRESLVRAVREYGEGAGGIGSSMRSSRLADRGVGPHNECGGSRFKGGRRKQVKATDSSGDQNLSGH